MRVPILETGRVLAAERFADAPAGLGLESDQVTYGPGDGDQPARVSRVTVAGQVVVEQGKLVHGDLEALRAEARAEAQKLWARMAAL